jgi:hypothetical protein
MAINLNNIQTTFKWAVQLYLFYNDYSCGILLLFSIHYSRAFQQQQNIYVEPSIYILVFSKNNSNVAMRLSSSSNL